MIFSSLLFLFVYLPIVLLLYYIVPLRFRNPVLLIANLVFYGWGEPVYVILMIFSIFVDYIIGVAIERNKTAPKRAKVFLIGSIIWNIGLLFFFKYYDYLLGVFQQRGMFTKVPLLELTLPIGISFYTFQKLSYTIDVYRRDCTGQKNFIDFSVFVTLFPQLIAGPILQYKDLAEQLKSRAHAIGKFRDGIRIFTVGLCKKVLLANSIGMLWENYRQLNITQLSMLGAWIGVVAFCFQIYFDFSGYSDMAIGLGKMLGFEFKENFNYPYISKSITDFWRRWHISLSSWFRDYLYIPLGGNRKGKWKWMRNIFIVWAATGIWHGASLNFLWWGLYYAVILMIEKLWMLKMLKKIPSVFQHVYTMFLILIGWAIFGAVDMIDISGYFKALFGMGNSFYVMGDFFQLSNYMILFVFLILASIPMGKKYFHLLPEKLKSVLEIVFVMSGLVLSTAYLVDSTYNPFLYFRF